MNVVNNQIRFKTPYQAAVEGGYTGTEEMFLSDLGKLSGIYDVSSEIPLTSGYYTQTTARAAVPVERRKKGIIISYNTSATVFKIEEFYIGSVSDWANPACWRERTDALNSEFVKLHTNINRVEADLQTESNSRESGDDALQTQITTLENQLAAAAGNLIYQTPVTDFADLATTYPIPALHWSAMVTALGYIYAWNGTDWVSTGLREFPENVATNDMLTIKINSNFLDGTNRIDASKINTGFINSDGSVTSGDNFYHTDYIPVKNGDILITNHNAGDTPKIVFYDAGFNKVSAVNSSVKKIVISEDGYVRFSIFSETADFSNICVANKFIGNLEFNPVSGYIDKNDFIEKNILFNLLSPNNIFAGYLDINGEIQPGAEFFHSGFIPVSNGDTVYINQDAGSVPKILLYDNNYSKVSAVNSSVKQITASVDGFVRFSIFGEGGNPQNVTITKNFNPNYHIPYNPIEGYLNTTKKILWLGTSIPEGCEYPIVASANNGALCFNKAVGASGIVLNTGVLGNGRDGKDLTETIAEKVTRYSGSVDAETLEIYKSWSFENLLMPYLSGENKVDIIVIDHGFNDREDIANEIAGLSGVNYDITSTSDRSTFTGAFKFLLNKIYTADPKIKVIIGGYMEKVSSTDKRYGSEIYTMHKKLSDVYGIPYLDVANLLNFTFNHVPGTPNFISDYNTANGTAYVNEWPDTDGNVTFFQYFSPDSVHPFTDKSGESNKRLNLIYTKLLRDLI